jgi:hypothetical protein
MGMYAWFMPVRRYISCDLKSKVDDSRKTVFEEVGPYTVKQSGGDHGHPPTCRRRCKLSEEQKEHIIAFSSTLQYKGPQSLMDSLASAKLIDAASTQKRVMAFMYKHRGTLKAPSREYKPYVKALKDFVVDAQKETKWDGDDETRTMLLPLPVTGQARGDFRDHVLLGNAVTQSNPQRTARGTKLSFCIPLSTPACLYNIVRSQELTYRIIDSKSLQTLPSTGAMTLEVPSGGFVQIDGVPGVSYGATIIMVGQS